MQNFRCPHHFTDPSSSSPCTQETQLSINSLAKMGCSHSKPHKISKRDISRPGPRFSGTQYNKPLAPIPHNSKNNRQQPFRPARSADAKYLNYRPVAMPPGKVAHHSKKAFPRPPPAQVAHHKKPPRPAQVAYSSKEPPPSRPVQVYPKVGYRNGKPAPTHFGNTQYNWKPGVQPKHVRVLGM